MLCGWLETGERLNSLEIQAGEHPEKTVPSKARDRRAADENGVEPEAGSSSRPNVSVAKQAT
ncbi:hypothetical protein KCTCHS21_03190 [Cohnella abietis]|uniref:Uncharacterized protein n=1 Tax=Cohnella abietis TaxID=2507935 RepID=A0A3T1CYK1_9BACL|nr:hypothetical protein KCTCHS21_03190 [Cohnella abietis]